MEEDEADYQWSPSGFLRDSYFAQTHFNNQQYGTHQAGGSAQLNVGIEYSGEGDFTTSTSPFSLPASYQPYQSHDPMDLSVLSTDNYQEGHYAQTNAGEGDGSNTMLYGGLVASSSHDTISPSPPAPNTRTRRTSKKDDLKDAAAEENTTRQKGRPRLNTSDQTAAERRRTQIRLAQRAYRQRKEKTISGLKERVTSLEKTIEDMHRTSLAFRDKAIASDIHDKNPALAKHLESTTERLASLAKNTARESDAEDEETDPTPTAEVAEGYEPMQLRDQTVEEYASNQVPMLGYQNNSDEEADDDDGENARLASASQASLEHLPLFNWTATEAMQRSQIEVPTVGKACGDNIGQSQQHASPKNYVVTNSDANDMFECDVRMSEEHTIPDCLPLGDAHLVTKTRPEFPAMRASDLSTLPLPASYSFREASFARRLLRSSAEAGYRVLTDPNTRPEEIKYHFKFSWHFANRTSIVHRLKVLMDGTAKQNLVPWDVPAMHLGGAGLHYPRVGIDAGGAPLDCWATGAPAGPPRPLKPETPAPDAMTVGQIAERVGFDGQWFDSNDVEQYLRTKGLYLNEQSSLVELIETDSSLPSFSDDRGHLTSSSATSSQYSIWGPHSPRDPEMSSLDEPFLQDTGYQWKDDFVNMQEMPEMPELNMDFSFGDLDFSNSETIPSNLPDFSMSSNTLPIFNTRMKKFVDVDKLLDTIIKSAVCLGATPGFRKATVDSALALATTEGY